MRNDSSLKADVIVVGSGPGGATVARQLAKSGKQVFRARSKIIILAAGGIGTPRILLNSGFKEAGAEKSTIFMRPFIGTYPSGSVRIGNLLNSNLETDIQGL
jgi:choline dehydrogenase-like flavoprotein